MTRRIVDKDWIPDRAAGRVPCLTDSEGPPLVRNDEGVCGMGGGNIPPVIPDKRRPGWFTCLGVNPLRDPGSSFSDFVFGTHPLDSSFRRNDEFGCRALIGILSSPSRETSSLL